MANKELTALEALTLLKNLRQSNIDDQEVEGILLDIIEEELKEHRLLKKLEEELGIDLITLFKALKDKQVIFKHIYGLKKPKIYLETHKIAGLLFDGKNYDLWLYDNGYGNQFCAYTKDYGKTWALTKEELEDDT